MDLLTRLSESQLRAALSGLEQSGPGSDHLAGIEFLLNRNTHDLDSIVSELNSTVPTLRKYGLIAAVRFPGAGNEAFQYAASIQDPDVQSFVRTKLNAST